MKRVHLKVYGRVQGVFFRANTQKEATRLGLRGFVRNTDDGAVEVTAEGAPDALEALILWCHKGPPHAAVLDVDVQWEEAQGLSEGFQISH